MAGVHRLVALRLGVLRPAAIKNTGWKTVWYKDSTDVSSSGWQHVEITHYLDPDYEPYTDDAHRLMIPPGLRGCAFASSFNSVDGAANNYFGWIVDNIEKHHSYDKPGCKICHRRAAAGLCG